MLQNCGRGWNASFLYLLLDGLCIRRDAIEVVLQTQRWNGAVFWLIDGDVTIDTTRLDAIAMRIHVERGWRGYRREWRR